MIERVWIIRNARGGEVLRVIDRRGCIELRTAGGHVEAEAFILHPEEAHELAEALIDAAVATEVEA